VLFNNAGVGTMPVGGTVETIALDKWDLALDVNVRAMYLVGRAALPALRRAGGDSIINTASVSAFRGSTGRRSHAYAASKGAVLALTRAMRRRRPRTSTGRFALSLEEFISVTTSLGVWT
jgi:NAD(P)-dependent dehydrogenase (short-subunit alcohol dehydrogenase family)